ncbi:MAG: dipeptidase [Gemmatimonadetes bacterium]|nr:dipeptidase [Gemmatimonadota bacterium]
MRYARLLPLFLLIGCAAAPGTRPRGASASPEMATDRFRVRAERILDDTPLIDGHNDIWDAMKDRRWGVADVDLTQPRPELHTDLPRLRAGRVGAQFWSAYVSTAYTGPEALRQALANIEAVRQLVARYEELEPARTADDIARIHRSGRIASLIGMEGGHTIESSLANLRTFHDLGVSYLTLTHAATTDWADAATDAPRHGGLSPFGEEVVREMNRLGMFVDLSHVSPETMHDALRVTRAPVIFSHSSARAVTDNPRNVPDDVLRLLPRNGGVVMVTFVPQFVSSAVGAWNARRDSVTAAARAAGPDSAGVELRFREWAAANPSPRATLSDVADHIDHIRRVIGSDYIGIGADFDGITSTPVGLENVSTYPALFAELARRGYSDQELRKIAGLNLLRAMRRMESVARGR